MKRILILSTVLAAVALAGTADVARADHYRSCRPGYSNYSFGFQSSLYTPPTYYNTPSWRGYHTYHSHSYFRPSYGSGYGFNYFSPGFSISIGRSGYGWHHHHYHRH